MCVCVCVCVCVYIAKLFKTESRNCAILFVTLITKNDMKQNFCGPLNDFLSLKENAAKMPKTAISKLNISLLGDLKPSIKPP